MSTSDKNPLDALFAEAVNAVEKVKDKPPADGEMEFEIEFVTEDTPPAKDEIEFDHIITAPQVHAGIIQNRPRRRGDSLLSRELNSLGTRITHCVEDVSSSTM